MKSSIIDNWRELSLLEDEWNALLFASRSNTIFLTWQWVQAWRSVVGENKELFVITVRDNDGRLVGIAPFYRYRLRLFKHITYKALRILADHATGYEYGDWIVHADCEKPALNAIADELKRSTRHWDLIWMPKISGWSGTHERLTDTLNTVGFLYHSRESSFGAFSLPETLLAFEEGFSAKRRQQLRRNKRKLMSTPGVAIKHCRNQDELPEFIDALFDLHHQRRMLLGDTGCFKRKPAEAEFYRQFLPKALAKGWLRLVALTQDDKIEAIQIGYAYKQDFLQLQEGFNPEYVNGAGNVLRHIIIEACIDEGLKSYDFLGGFTEHKRRWGAQERFGHDLMIGHPGLKNRLLFFKEIWPTGRHIQEEGLFDGN